MILNPPPKCDFCGQTAAYDGKTIHGPWAYMCDTCFIMYGRPIKGLYTKLEVDAVTTADNKMKED